MDIENEQGYKILVKGTCYKDRSVVYKCHHAEGFPVSKLINIGRKIQEESRAHSSSGQDAAAEIKTRGFRLQNAPVRINAVPGPFALKLHQPADLSIRRMQRHC